MQQHLTFRHLSKFLGALLLAQLITSPSLAQTGQRRGPTAPQRSTIVPDKSQEHLAQWMERHSNLTISDQQHALDREPGFHDLAPQVQERMHERLSQLNNMTPQQRQRVLARTEAMEHLTLEQRQHVRGVMNELSGLPPDRRHAVAHAFRNLRNLPPEQRQAALNSDRIHSSFSDGERSTLASLIGIEPLLPPQGTPQASPPH